MMRMLFFDSFICLISTDEKSLAVRQPWYDPLEKDDEINRNARRAFETVLFVRQRLYTDERFRRFAANVVHFARITNRTNQSTHESVRSFRDEILFE